MLGVLALAAAAVMVNGCDLDQHLKDNVASGEQAFALQIEDDLHYHVHCYAMGEAANGELQVVQRVVTEIFQGELGIASSIVDEDAMYPCQGEEFESPEGGSQSLWGSIQFFIQSVNGVQAYDEPAESLAYNDEPVCGGGSDRLLFDNLHVTQVVNEHLTIDTHFFKNDAAQAEANLQHTMSIGSMDECKLEAIYSFKPNSGGGLDVVAEIRLHAATTAFENFINEAMSHDLNTAENKLTMFVPPEKLVEAAGLGPTGCNLNPNTCSPVPNTANSCNGSQTMIDVSLNVTCGATGKSISADAIFTGGQDGAAATLSLTVSADDAPESCGVMYWDPLVTPIKVDESGRSLNPDDDDLKKILMIVVPVAGVILLGAVAFIVYRKRKNASEKASKSESAAADTTL